jgi:hypothetical protein
MSVGVVSAEVMNGGQSIQPMAVRRRAAPGRRNHPATTADWSDRLSEGVRSVVDARWRALLPDGRDEAAGRSLPSGRG